MCARGWKSACRPSAARRCGELVEGTRGVAVHLGRRKGSAARAAPVERGGPVARALSAAPGRRGALDYEALARALEAGIARGLARGRRAKSRAALADALFRALMDELAPLTRPVED